MHPFGLAVGLGVVGRRGICSATQQSPQGFPKSSCESGVSVVHHGTGHTVHADHVLEKQMCDTLRGKMCTAHPTRNQLYQLSQTVHAREHTIEPLDARQIRYEVHAPFTKSLGRYRQRLHFARRTLGPVLYTVADTAIPYVLGYILPHAWPPHATGQQL